MQILAIETSCDETAASVVEKSAQGVFVLNNVVASQIKLHQKFGGVFPEHASRAHAEKIIPVAERALDKRRSVNVIAVTTGPGLIGSLLIGVNFAKTLAFANGLPIIGINHLLGHIYSNWAQKPFPNFPAIVMVISGGHTGLYLMKDHNNIKALGATLDDAAGEAFDKVARILGLGYPGGPAIAKAAQKGNPQAFNFPRSMLERQDFDFSFSGLKTAVLYQSKKVKSKNKADFAASFQQAVIDILVGKTIQAASKFRPKSICFCGGVSANKELRQQLKKAVSDLSWCPSFHVPAIHLSTDNAAMIGIAAAYHVDQKTTWDKVRAEANLKL